MSESTAHPMTASKSQHFWDTSVLSRDALWDQDTKCIGCTIILSLIDSSTEWQKVSASTNSLLDRKSFQSLHKGCASHIITMPFSSWQFLFSTSHTRSGHFKLQATIIMDKNNKVNRKTLFNKISSGICFSFNAYLLYTTDRASKKPLCMGNY